jgi:hypothetical protein
MGPQDRYHQGSEWHVHISLGGLILIACVELLEFLFFFFWFFAEYICIVPSWVLLCGSSTKLAVLLDICPSLKLLLFDETGNWIQGLTLARKVLSHLSHTPSPWSPFFWRLKTGFLLYKIHKSSSAFLQCSEPDIFWSRYSPMLRSREPLLVF